MIIETCPKCGHDLVNIMLASYPPIPKKECWSCGWSWTDEREEIVRVPFHENQGEIVNDDCTLLNAHLDFNNTIAVDVINKVNIKLC